MTLVSTASRVAGSGRVIDYATTTSDLAITATSTATAQTYVAGNAVTLDGSTLVRIEGYCPSVTSDVTTSPTIVVSLYDGSTELLRLGQFKPQNGAAVYFAAAYLTPTAGSHTYSLRFSKSATSGNQAATGNITGTGYPGYIRVTAA